jgi:hypothetical protein
MTDKRFQYEFHTTNNDQDGGRFDRCSFLLKARDGSSDTFFAVSSGLDVEADADKEEGDKWYVNFRGHFGYSEFTDGNSIYSGLSNINGAPIVSFERANDSQNIMSFPFDSNANDQVYSAE